MNFSVQEEEAFSDQDDSRQQSSLVPRGLDLDLVRQQREELRKESVVTVSSEEADLIPGVTEQLSELGKSISELLLESSAAPHRHMKDFKERLDRMLSELDDIPLGQWMRGSSSFFQFGRSKYVFSDSTAVPTLVMKSVDEVDREKQLRANKYRDRSSGAVLKRLKEALKKHKKKGKPGLPDTEDFDIFGEIIQPTVTLPSSSIREISEPLFASSIAGSVAADLSQPYSAPSDAQIQEAFRKRAETRMAVANETSRSNNHMGLSLDRAADDEYFASKGEFGQKLNVSQFASAEQLSQSLTKKQKLGQEKQVFNQVMKRLDKNPQ